MLSFVQINSREFFAVQILFTLEHEPDQWEIINPKETKNGEQRQPRCFTHRFFSFSDKSLI